MENKKLKQENAQLERSLEKATQESTLKQLADAKLRRDYADAVAVLGADSQRSAGRVYAQTGQTEDKCL